MNKDKAKQQMTPKDRLKKLVEAFKKAKLKRSEAAKRRRDEMTKEQRLQKAALERGWWHKRKNAETIAEKEERLMVAKIKRDNRTKEQKEKGLAARRMAHAVQKETKK